jgi:hypothetical protein
MYSVVDAESVRACDQLAAEGLFDGLLIVD